MGWWSSWLLRTAGKASAARFDAALEDPFRTQERKLFEILRRNAGTDWGREHGFSDVATIADWRRQPIVDWDDVADWVDRMVNGEENVLTAERPVMFARTSGTTGRPKHVPITPTCRGRDHADQFRTWLHHASTDHPRMYAGKILSLVSPAEEGRTPAGIPYGSVSGVIYRDNPAPVKKLYVTPYPVFEIDDYDTRYLAILSVALRASVTFLATANPSSITKLCDMADGHAESLLRDMHDGGFSRSETLSPEVRAALLPHLRPNRDRARELEAARSRRGALLPADVWPDLALIGCWKGGTVGGHLDRFSRWFDPDGRRPVPVRDLGYLSSEARGTIPMSDTGASGVLGINAGVFEFVPVRDVEEFPDDPSRWSPRWFNEVDTGADYHVLLTTTGGLYRYDINDIVRVTGWRSGVPEIAFLRKGRGVTSITGEKVTVNQVIEAVRAASKDAGWEAEHFRAEADPAFERYVFKVEGRVPLPESLRERFLRAVDGHLRRLNLEYEAKRASGRLSGPVLHVMKCGWYESGKRALVAEGRRLFQAKTNVLAVSDGASTAPAATADLLAVQPWPDAAADEEARHAL